MSFQFGTGSMWLKRTDTTLAVPRKVGVLQDVKVEFSSSLKPLHGAQQFALGLARGKVQIKGSAKFALLQAGLFNDIFFGATLGTGQLMTINGEAAVVPTTPFTVTVANGATFSADLGVIDVSTGMPMQPVASGPTTGQYSVNTTTGLYTFAAADTTKAVQISYTYTIAATGQKITGANPLIGINPVFQTVLEGSYTAPGAATKKTALILYACVASKLTVDPKQEDWTEANFDFECFDPGTGIPYVWSFPESAS